jgi:hypothetical protein
MKRPAFGAALSLLLLAACSSNPLRSAPRPMTAEMLNPAVTPENVQKTVCVPAYAASVLPSRAELQRIQLDMMQRAGVDQALAASYVLDHRIPVALGGHPTHAANLQLLELRGEYGAQRKQALERQLWLRVCESKMGLREAQAAMYPDWSPAYGLYVGNQP